MEPVALGGPFPWSLQDMRNYANDDRVAMIMYEIAFFQNVICRDQEAWLEALKGTADDIIEQLREGGKA